MEEEILDEILLVCESVIVAGDGWDWVVLTGLIAPETGRGPNRVSLILRYPHQPFDVGATYKLVLERRI